MAQPERQQDLDGGKQENFAVGELLFDGIPRALDEAGLRASAEKHIAASMETGKDILGFARRHRKDVVAKVTARGQVLYIGVGIAATLVAVGGVIIYKHSKRK
jgi:hypothetical protein